jgi:hypothetical protein
MSEHSRDELLIQTTYNLAKLVDDGISQLTKAEQNMITAAVGDGAHVMVLAVLNPLPTYIVSLSTRANEDPIELFRVVLNSQAMSLLTTRGQTATGH